MGGSKPRVWGWRFQGLLAREVSLWGVRLWRGLQGPSATESEGHFLFCLFFPAVPSGAVENRRAQGRSRLQVRSLSLAEATRSLLLVLPEMMRTPYLGL